MLQKVWLVLEEGVGHVVHALFESGDVFVMHLCAGFVVGVDQIFLGELDQFGNIVDRHTLAFMVLDDILSNLRKQIFKNLELLQHEFDRFVEL